MNDDFSDLGKLDFRRLPLNPHSNPLIEPQQIHTRMRKVRSGISEELINPATGEIKGVSTIYSIEEKDDEQFVKVFAAGVSASYELSRTAQRVFQAVLEQYQNAPMSRGYADSVNLLWFDDGLDGRQIGMSEKTFRRGLKELLSKKFLAPKDGVSYWVNPALFFRGNRVIFLKEYRLKAKTQKVEDENKKAGRDPNTLDMLENLGGN